MESLETYGIVKLFRRVENGVSPDLKDLCVSASDDFHWINGKIQLSQRKKIEPVRKLIDDIAHLRVHKPEEVQESVSIFKTYIIPFLEEEERSKRAKVGSANVVGKNEDKKTSPFGNENPLAHNIQRTSFNEETKIHLARGPDRLTVAFRELFYKRPRELLFQDITNLRNSQILAIECLMKILQKSFEICKQEADLQLRRAEECAKEIVKNGKTDPHSINVSTLEKTSDDLLKRYRYIHADMATERLQMLLLQEAQTLLYNTYNININENTNLILFTRDCVEITWLMSVEDPVIYMVNDNGAISEDIYDIARGKPNNAIVWPALRFECSDNILSKGIAWSK